VPTQRFYCLSLRSFSILLPPPPPTPDHFTATHPSAATVAKSAKTVAGYRHGFKFKTCLMSKQANCSIQRLYIIPDRMMMMMMMMMMMTISPKLTRRLMSMVSVWTTLIYDLEWGLWGLACHLLASHFVSLHVADNLTVVFRVCSTKQPPWRQQASPLSSWWRRDCEAKQKSVKICKYLAV
jgi:hypothetical protein